MPKNIIEIINAIKKIEGYRFDRQVAEQMGIDGRTLATYKSRGELPHHFLEQFRKKYNIRPNQLNDFLKNIDNYNNFTNKQNTIGIDIMNKQEGLLGRTQNNDQQLIDLQKEKIERLEQDLIRHKSTPVQETLWNQLEFDFQCEVKLTFEYFTMGRSILSITNKELQSKVLGYSANELEKLWDIGTYYKNSEKHPIDAMLHKNTLKGIKEQIKSLPALFEQLKNMMGNHYIPQPLTYVCKNKSLINAIAYNKVNWREKTVSSKIKFLLDE